MEIKITESGTGTLRVYADGKKKFDIKNIVASPGCAGAVSMPICSANSLGRPETSSVPACTVKSETSMPLVWLLCPSVETIFTLFKLIIFPVAVGASLSSAATLSGSRAHTSGSTLAAFPVIS